MSTSFNISNRLAYSLICTVVVGEILSLIRYCFISKSEAVAGTSIGWFGVTKDTSDHQWHAYESNLLTIMQFQIFCLGGSYCIKKFSDPMNKLRFLQIFSIVVGISFSFAAMSLGVIFQFSLLILFYLAQKLFIRMKYFNITLWVVIIVILYLNERFNGYRFAMISPLLTPLDEYQENNQQIQWHTIFNMMLLRIISFSLDHYWAHSCLRIETKDHYKELVQKSHPLKEYNFRAFLSYVYYSPLLITGPTVTFNAFHSQLKTSQANFSKKQFLYVIRVYVVNLLTFEIFLHLCYSHAIPNLSENIHIWKNFSFLDFHVMSFANLIFLWYKFMVIWRISTAWALLDGIEVPENMSRCIYNNYNFSGFWRSWHRSFNQWLIRYLYIPLGGSKYKAINIWVIFLFVALWHDFKADLLFWAGIICLALLPEMTIMHFFNKPKYYKYWWFKYVTAVACGFQIEMMILANFIGFGQGKDCLNHMIEKYWNLESIIMFILMASIRNGTGVILGLWVRQREEKQKNIKNY